MTDRQKRVAAMLAQGLETRVIRERLGISNSAVQGYVSRIRGNDQTRRPNAANEQAKRDTEVKKAQLADLVADGLSITQAAKQMGLTQQRGSQLWGMIRADLNAPAVD